MSSPRDPNRNDSTDALPCIEQADGIQLAVRVTPRGGRDTIDGIVELSDGRRALKVRVRVAPEDGAANRAVEKTIAQALKVPVSRVAVMSGATARLKHIRIEGEPRHLMETLRAFLRME